MVANEACRQQCRLSVSWLGVVFARNSVVVSVALRDITAVASVANALPLPVAPIWGTMGRVAYRAHC